MFVRHATLLRTLDEAAKMQLIQDMTAFEECLGRVTSLQQLPGSAYSGFRALRRLLFVEVLSLLALLVQKNKY